MKAAPKTTTPISSSEEELHRAAQNVASRVQADQKLGELESAISDGNNVDDNVAGNVDSNVQPPTDGALKETMYSLIKMGVGIVHTQWEWSEPSEEWKRGVAELAAAVATKWIGSMAETYSTEGALVITVGVWVMANVQEKGFPTFKKKPAENTNGAAADHRNPGGHWVGEEHVGTVPAD